MGQKLGFGLRGFFMFKRLALAGRSLRFPDTAPAMTTKLPVTTMDERVM